MKENTETKSLETLIMEDLKNTGFIAELKVGSILNKHDWKTFPCFSYMDKDEGKSREIDMIASKIGSDEELQFNLYVDLVIEIKKSNSKHWIVFTVPKSNPDLGWSIIHGGTNHIKHVKSLFDEPTPTMIFNYKNIENGNPKTGIERVGKAFHEFKKSEKDTSQIYGSLISCAKAAIYHRDLFHNLMDIRDFDVKKHTSLSLYIPIVVFDGLLFEVFNDNEGEIQIQAAQYIPVEMQYSSPNYSQSGFYSTFHPDLITIDYLPKYLQNIEVWINKMWEGFKNDLGHVIAKGTIKY